MAFEIHEECGVFGIVNSKNAAQLTYYGLHALQHRGEEGAGIVVRRHKLHIEKGVGLVNDVFNAERLSRLTGSAAIGHVRYSTAGGGGIHNVQPFLFRTLKEDIAVAHNGNIINAQQLKQTLEEAGALFHSSSDTEILGHLLSRHKGTMVERLIASLKYLDGAFAFVILTEGALYGACDRYGLRPLVLGQMNDGAYVLSSETCALDLIGAKYIRDLNPGEIVRIDREIHSCSYTKDTHHAMCAMEYIYFSRPDSVLENNNVHSVRKLTGRILWNEAPVEADVVIGVPDSSISAASGYAEASGIPNEMGLIKNKYVGRTFIQPTKELREQGVRMKLSAVSSIVKGKRVVLIDDSIVRGTTSKRIVTMLRHAGAKEIHVRIASPMIRYPCFYGVDTSTKEELIAHLMKIDDLRDYLEADSLAFISITGLKQAASTSQGLCLACFNGDYITNHITINE
ncbi:MAG: amidophosphoribosyltransferase [Erysipelotrichaceae bacterium]|nr:amidophosphoribosyltransferase [Erysipelotrichaceae bacterium]